jgi:asparaginyl-tRNA synthetase
LRCRTNTIGAVARIRNALAYATHTFFQQRGFLYVHTPIITASDCEGAGEMFAVTNVLPEPHEPIMKARLKRNDKVPKPEAEIAEIKAKLEA